jgi:UDP-3-O-acyl-N-acetylglucosamine deacetylase
VESTFNRTQVGPVHTVEHLMSAFAGLGLSDALVELDAPEVPGMDGSALPFVQGLKDAGWRDLGEATVPRLFARVFYIEGDVRIALGAGEGHFKYTFDTGGRWPGVQSAEVMLSEPGAYEEQVAGARTLVFASDAEKVGAAGLGQGLDSDGYVVIGETGYESAVRFADEPARHKLLDLIGDLALIGYPLRLLNVVAERSGHRTHVEAGKKVLSALGWLEVSS